jgi:hypothetical protein
MTVTNNLIASMFDLLFLTGHAISIMQFINYLHLFFVSNFLNMLQIESENKVVPVYSLDAEFARPLWIFGNNSYEFVKSPKQRNLIACSYR